MTNQCTPEMVPGVSSVSEKVLLVFTTMMCSFPHSAGVSRWRSMVARQKLSGAGPMPGVGPELMRSASSQLQHLAGRYRENFLLTLIPAALTSPYPYLTLP